MLTREDMERAFGTYVEPDDETLYLEMCDDFCVQVILEMERQGLTVTEVARRMGVAQPTLSRQLSGEQNLTAKTMAKIARALGCTVEAPKLVKASAERACVGLSSVEDVVPAKGAYRADPFGSTKDVHATQDPIWANESGWKLFDGEKEAAA